MKLSKRSKWTDGDIARTPQGPRVVSIYDGHVTVAYVPAAWWWRVL